MKIETEVLNKLLICDSPLVSQNLSILRNKNTNPESFRAAVKRLSRIVISKAFDNIPLVSQTVETPMMETEVDVIDNNCEFIISPILRAGLIFSEVALDIFPEARVHHIGIFRDEKTLKPVAYYNNLPKKFKDPNKTYVYIFDPMLATGGSAAAAVKLFVDLGVPEKNITFICLISAPEGVSRISSEFPNINIITGALDNCLNENGYILPGLGDAGDRTFNTLK